MQPQHLMLDEVSSTYANAVACNLSMKMQKLEKVQQFLKNALFQNL